MIEYVLYDSLPNHTGKRPELGRRKMTKQQVIEENRKLMYGTTQWVTARLFDAIKHLL